MDIGLWVRNGDAFFAKAVEDFFLNSEIDIPIISCIDPGANDKVYAAVTEFG